MRTERTAGQNLIGPGRAAPRTTPVRDWFRWLWTEVARWAQAVGILVALAALELIAGWVGGFLDPNWGPVAGAGALVVVLGFLIRDPA